MKWGCQDLFNPIPLTFSDVFFKVFLLDSEPHPQNIWNDFKPNPWFIRMMSKKIYLAQMIFPNLVSRMYTGFLHAKPHGSRDFFQTFFRFQRQKSGWILGITQAKNTQSSTSICQPIHICHLEVAKMFNYPDFSRLFRLWDPNQDTKGVLCRTPVQS